MSSPAPVLARVFRGGRVESTHRGSVAVVDERARILAFAGNPMARIYLRSAAKPFQAMPLLAAGGERAF
jgi:L-asparaginase II